MNLKISLLASLIHKSYFHMNNEYNFYIIVLQIWWEQEWTTTTIFLIATILVCGFLYWERELINLIKNKSTSWVILFRVLWHWSVIKLFSRVIQNKEVVYTEDIRRLIYTEKVSPPEMTNEKSCVKFSNEKNPMISFTSEWVYI
jgi:hypothetical protein